jgi:hypothetical protein
MELSAESARVSILEALLMLKKKCIRFRRAEDRSGLPLSISGNPLWPLEELHNLRKPRFVADPELTPLAIEALRSKTESSSASTPDNTHIGTATLDRPFVRLREFPIPPLVGGMPWRFRDHGGCRIVPDPEFTPLDLAFFRRG